MILSIVSLIVALGALIFSFYTYFAHDRELKRQEKIINEFQLSALEREEEENKKAKIRGSIIKTSSKGCRELRIFNAGKVIAKSVKMEWLNCRDDDGIYLQINSDDLGNISPQDKRVIHMSLDEGHEELMKLRYTWADDYSAKNSYQEEIQVL